MSTQFKRRALRAIVTAALPAALLFGLGAASAGATGRTQVAMQAPAVLRSPGVIVTATYSCDDGGTYYVRQVGNQIWWYGESGDGGATWSNVFSGTRSGNTVTGNWADVPKGIIRGTGRLILHVDSPTSFHATGKSGGFGGSKWSSP
jgi:hypothetical protein